MTWVQPHISKIYEAIGAIADNRVELTSENEAKVYSSSRNKFYTVTWTDAFSQMMSNDNSAYWVGQLSYPMIAVLILKGKLRYDESVNELLKDIKWKDINQKFKNKFDKTVEYVLDELKQKEINTAKLENELGLIMEQVAALRIEFLGKRVLPPKGY